MVAILVGIARHHLKGLAATDALHGEPIDAQLQQVRDGGMPDHLRDVQASPRHGKPEELFNGYGVA